MVALAKNGEKKKRLMIIVATTSLPAVDCPNAGTPHARANYTLHNVPHILQGSNKILVLDRNQDTVRKSNFYLLGFLVHALVQKFFCVKYFERMKI